MANCVIHPISIWVSPADKSRITYNVNFGVPACVTGYTWYIEGLREKVLVDCGGDPEFLSKFRTTPAYYVQSLEAGLNEMGLSVSDIDLVIQTHLHSDHVAFGSKYPKARILVQRKELEYARNPHPLFARLYVKEFFEGLNFEVVDGDTQIYEGVSVLLTPGHSPGGQSVSVKTDQGIAIICGMCTIRENFEPEVLPTGEVTAPVVAPAIHTNIYDAYDNMMKIKEMADILVPLHDPEYMLKRRIPWEER